MSLERPADLTPPSICATSRFSTEADLVEAVADFLATSPGRRYAFVAEHEAGFGRPDLLLYDQIPTQGPDLAALSRISPRLAPLLSPRAARRIRSLQDLERATGSSVDGTKKIAGQLRGLGRLRWISSTQFQISPISTLPFPNVIAVEAKLQDWRRGLVQAYRYRQFASESWVLLDASRAGLAASNERSFRAAGVGLASFSTDGKLYIHVPAENSGIPDGALAWRTQTMLARGVDRFKML